MRVSHAIAAVAICAALCAVATSEPAQHRSTWLLLEITNDGHTRILAAKDSTQPPSKCRGHPVTPNDHVVVQYTHPETGKECAVPIMNPRKEYHDHETAPGKFGGGAHHHDAIEFAVTVHADVAEFHVHDYKNRHFVSRHFVTQEHHKAFHTLQSTVTVNPALIEPKAVQIVGPVEEQFNLVFLSSGYTAAQRERFETDVANLVKFMQLQVDGLKLSSQPYRRYFSSTNIWQVWYPSEESGARDRKSVV